MLERMIKLTWASRRVDDVSTLFYRGGDETVDEGHGLLVVRARDGLEHVGEKTLAAFEHVLETRPFDVVFRTNCSSYVDLVNLRRFVSERPAGSFYAGVVGEHGGSTFASGSGYFLSRDLVELAVAQRDRWDHTLLDDVALGLLLARNGFTPTPAPRVDYRTPSEVVHVDTQQFHFRCRTRSPWRIDDARIMVRLDAAFRDARGLRVGVRNRGLRVALAAGSAVARSVGRQKSGG